MEPTWQTTIITKPLNFTKMRQSLTVPPLNNTARAITQRAWSIQRVLSNTPRARISKVIRPMQRANSKSN
jgi:hypothetical protein